ncbi:hypothetical protein PIB30_060466 [Stylosanthes scabra]|uniref:Uncharacterized protein n=1 Tax=Stylosanthes scabra TaxID=79078 RepID=A0ABU6RL58_9FABA|nr:hypothetical protein [Stylosanthes scabra]
MAVVEENRTTTHFHSSSATGAPWRPEAMRPFGEELVSMAVGAAAMAGDGAVSDSGAARGGDGHGALWRRDSSRVRTIFCNGGGWLGFMEPSLTLSIQHVRVKIRPLFLHWVGWACSKPNLKI